jgi:hypothetical protein
MDEWVHKLRARISDFEDEVEAAELTLGLEKSVKIIGLERCQI